MLRHRDVAVYRHVWGWECAAIVRGYRIHRGYSGYSRRAAIRAFLGEVNAEVTP